MHTVKRKSNLLDLYKHLFMLHITMHFRKLTKIEEIIKTPSVFFQAKSQLTKVLLLLAFKEI